MRAIAWTIDAHFTFGPAVNRADFLALSRTIPFGAPSFANRTDCFSRQFCSRNVIAARREIAVSDTIRANSLCESEGGRKPGPGARACTHVGRPDATPRKGMASRERARNYFSESGSERFLGDFLLSKETIF